MTKRRLLLAATLLIAAVVPASAQQFRPTRPIEFVVHGGPGSGNDVFARTLTTIIDRNGNTTQLAYDASNRLITVTDPASRHLNFTYIGSGYLVSGVSADVGISFSYTYDNQGRLIKVTKPDNTAVSFQYDTNFNITAVLDNEGKVLEAHTYDSAHRGLTSSRANGVEGITVAYPH